MIYTFIPFSPNRNFFGQAINECFEIIGDDDWAFIVDHDCFFTTIHWYNVLVTAVKKEPDAGCFCHWYNKGPKHTWWQVAPGVDPMNQDIAYHRDIGTRVLKWGGGRLQDAPKRRHLSGNFMMSKKVWKEIGGITPNRWRRLDWEVGAKVRQAGRKIYLMKSLYVYHAGIKLDRPYVARPGEIPE